jgi:hypothetical protein
MPKEIVETSFSRESYYIICSYIFPTIKGLLRMFLTLKLASKPIFTKYTYNYCNSNC